MFLLFELKNKDDQSTENNARKVAQSKYGNLQGHVDHLLILLNGTGNFEAYGFVNGYVSPCNDENTRYSSIIVHEITYYMKFDHSGKGNEKYGGGTGALGCAKVCHNDKKCINGVKSRDLRQYVDGH